MAVSISLKSHATLGGGAVLIAAEVTFDSSYPTGGETLDLSTYLGGSPVVIPSGDDGYVAQHDRGTAAAGKLLVYEAGADGAALDEVADTTDLSAVIVPIVAIGTPAQS